MDWFGPFKEAWTYTKALDFIRDILSDSNIQIQPEVLSITKSPMGGDGRCQAGELLKNKQRER